MNQKQTFLAPLLHSKEGCKLKLQMRHENDFQFQGLKLKKSIFTVIETVKIELKVSNLRADIFRLFFFCMYIEDVALLPEKHFCFSASLL